MSEGTRSLFTYVPRNWYALTFGKPDGWLIRLRCAIFDHDWRTCHDDCCEGKRDWCSRCNTFEDSL